MPANQEFECSDSPEEDPLLRIIEKYQNQPNIKLIKSKNKSQMFKFRDTNIDEIKTFQKSGMNTNMVRRNMFFFLQNVCVMISMLLFILQSFIMN